MSAVVVGAGDRLMSSPPPPSNDTNRPGLIRLTMNELRHLFTALLRHQPRDPLHLLHWSHWRRRHQARARDSHYRRQALQLE